MEDLYLPLKEAIIDGEVDDALNESQGLLDQGVNPLNIFTDCVEPTINELGEQFSRLEVFLPDLIIAGDVVTALQEKLLPIMKELNISGREKGKGIIATVFGDLHDIGKNMVSLMLDINGFQMSDLGVDVAPMAIVKKAEEINADFVCLSALMLPSLPYMKETIDLIKNNAKLKDHTLIMVGGGPVTETWAKSHGADGYADDAIGAVRLAHELLGISN